MKRFIMIMGLLLCHHFAMADDFIVLANVNGIEHSVNATKYQDKIIEGQPGFGTIVRSLNQLTNKAFFFKEYILKKDCEKNYGYIYVYELVEKDYEKVEWVKNGKTVASEYAQYLCSQL